MPPPRLGEETEGEHSRIRECNVSTKTDAQREAEHLAFLQDDNHLALWFTPDAIRDHFDSEAVDALSDEALRLVGFSALSGDPLYEAFHEVLVLALEEEGISTP
jgi:hypothetical protein